MTHRFNGLLIALLLLVGGPYYWLLLDNRPDGIPPMPVHMAQLRQLAGSMPGPLPESVGMTLVAHRLLPGNLIAAGSGMKRRSLGRIAFILPVNGSGPLLIEPGVAIGPEAGVGIHQAYPAGEGQLEAARRRAALILSTDGSPGAGAPHALAPGVVAIPAPSHSPHSQMIFVRLANGGEYLFAGEIAPLARSWQAQRGRARLVSDWLRPEDRRAVFAWLRTIRALKQEAPRLHVVPGYDHEWLADGRNLSGVKVDFSASPK